VRTLRRALIILISASINIGFFGPAIVDLIPSEFAIADGRYERTETYRGRSCKVTFYTRKPDSLPPTEMGWQNTSLNEIARAAQTNNDVISVDLGMAAGLGVSCMADLEGRDAMRAIMSDEGSLVQIDDGGSIIRILYDNTESLVVIFGAN
jgi:hypothetical protein